MKWVILKYTFLGDMQKTQYCNVIPEFMTILWVWNLGFNKDCYPIGDKLYWQNIASMLSPKYERLIQCLTLSSDRQYYGEVFIKRYSRPFSNRFTQQTNNHRPTLYVSVS
jgi:hypothetical protein